MPIISTYLNFNGNCREAMSFYRDCLDGKLTIQLIGESPIAANMPAEMQNSVLHSVVEVGNSRIMGSDMAGPDGLTQGNTMSLVLDCDSDEQIRDLLGKLSEGGTINHPLGDAFWGGTFGHFEDKYGVTWMLNYTK